MSGGNGRKRLSMRASKQELFNELERLRHRIDEPETLP